jgi:mono/diheme cytochrome c family protein
MMKLAAIVAAVLLWASAVVAAPTDKEYVGSVGPFLKAHCVSCHGGTKPKADLALDALAPDFSSNADTWIKVRDRLIDGSMPPKDKGRPNAREQKAVTEWVASRVADYQAKRAATEGRARLRRLNRVEYVNTLRDLLGVEADIEALPEDGSHGFDNVDSALDLSSTLLERYLEAADAALDGVFARERPKTTKQRIEMVPLAKRLTRTARPQPRFGVNTEIRENDVIFYTEDQPPKVIIETRVPATGLYRFRISAQAIRPTNGKAITVRIYAGNYQQANVSTRLAGAFDVPDQLGVIEFTERMRASESIRISPYGMPALYGKLAENHQGPGLAVQWVEVEGPLVDAWPPAATTRLLGNVDPARGTLADAETILRRFAPRAFRRTVADSELAPYVALVKSRLDRGYKFEPALRVGLKGILCSPDFLYLATTPGKLNDFDLAARLSYFLWSTTPDDALAAVAARGDLGKPEVLRAQVERMLADPKAHAFTVNFTGQWLNLRDLKATNPDKQLYPDFDDLLEVSMPQETHLFFEEILKNDRNVLEFVHSDWSMLNERLAAHYGIPGVTGHALRKVSLPAKSHRGGVLTQAAVLKVTANGTNTSPVTRGTWVLDRILGTPTPPPPKDVPAIEPDIRGAKTIREQLAKHRTIASCASCHTKIDPPGNALENFDVIGGWREHYRTDARQPGPRQKVKTEKRMAPVGVGKPVEAADELPGNRKFTGIDEFKKLVLEDPDQFTRTLTQKLLVYGTGHKLELADRDTVEKIVAEVRQKKYGFRTLIHAITQSPTFRSK